MLSTVRRRRELSATRARAAREPNVRTILHEICRLPRFSLLRVHHAFASFPFIFLFFSSVPREHRLYNSTSIDSSLHGFHVPPRQRTAVSLARIFHACVTRVLRECRLSFFFSPTELSATRTIDLLYVSRRMCFF